MSAIAIGRNIALGTTDIGDEERRLVDDVLTSGRVSPGAYQRSFEQAVAERHGKQYATLVNSGQSALHLSLEALKRRDPSIRRVLCPAVTYISTLHAVWNAGMVVVLADVDPVDFLITPGDPFWYDMALPVDLFGKAWRPINLGAPAYVEDACEAIGAPGVGYGDLVCLSFYASHSVTTGSGGMVLTDDIELDQTVKRLANHGRREASDLYMTPGKGKKFVFDDVGYSYKSSDLNAALGLAQLNRLEGMILKRQRLAARLINGLDDLADLQLPVRDRHTFQMFPIICREPGTRDGLTDYLNERGVETREAMPIVTQPIVQEKLGIRPDDYPVAAHVARDGFYVGCHHKLTDDDIDWLIDVFHQFGLGRKASGDVG